jgi:cellulose synthase/poly-beta-1,6-N-acetylglucosamine synthase-like glycosyltransferase
MTQLTIGIPVFNAMPYLRESIESILYQTYSDFVIVAVNDGSTDDSLEYLTSRILIGSRGPSSTFSVTRTPECSIHWRPTTPQAVLANFAQQEAVRSKLTNLCAQDISPRYATQQLP